MSADRRRPDSSETRDLNFAQLSSLPDEAVMTYLQSGHDDGLAVLFDRYHRLVLSIGARILRDPGEAEDLMQAVFLEIYRAKAQFDPLKGTVRAWLLQYTYHRCLNRWHYLKVRGLSHEKSSARANEWAEETPANPERPLNPVEASLLVRQGLAGLTTSQRNCLELAFFEGLSMGEIATRTKQPVGNVRHHYYRGLRALRSLLFGNGGPKGQE